MSNFGLSVVLLRGWQSLAWVTVQARLDGYQTRLKAIFSHYSASPEEYRPSDQLSVETRPASKGPSCAAFPTISCRSRADSNML